MQDTGQDEQRTFRIEGQPKKKFVVQSSTPVPESKKKFQVDGDRIRVVLPGTNREMMFARQRNASDCGPCLVLNTLQAVQAESGLSSVADVRQFANQLRIAQNEALRTKNPRWGVDDPTLPDTGWFTNADVDEVLRAQGLTVQSWVVDTEEARRAVQAHIDERIRNGERAVMYTGTGRHYRGIYNGDGGLLKMDSLSPAVERVQGGAFEDMIRGAGQSDRREFISIASQPTPTPTTT